MGSIKKLPNGKYKISVHNKYGKRIRIVFEKQSEAQAYINRIEVEKSDMKLIRLGLKQERMSIQDAITEFLKTKIDLRLRSYSKYEHTLEQFQIFCGRNKIGYVDEFQNGYSDKFKELLVVSKAAPKTINAYLMTVKALFDYQVKKERISKNPFYHVEFVKQKRKTLLERENDYYTEDELKALFELQLPTHIRNAFAAFFLTGCRFSELANLKWDNIDLCNNIIMIRSTEEFTTKTYSSERDIPITNVLYRIIMEIKQKTESEYVFTTKYNQKLRERRLLEECKVYCAQAGIKKNATLHKFRHSFASHILSLGLEYEERQYLLGHKPRSMTEHYTKVDSSKLREKLCGLDLIINKLIRD